MRAFYNRISGRYPLATILCAGFLSLIASGLGAYYWAHTPVDQESSSLVQKRSASSDEQIESEAADDSEDTIPLNRNNWESFLDFEGKRERMLGIKRSYNRVNVRSGPSMDNPIIATPEGGSLMEPLDRFNQWYRVRLPDGTLGWAYKSLVRQLEVPLPVVQEIRRELRPLKESVKSTIPRSFRDRSRVEVIENAVNIRQGPGTQFQIVDRVYRHEELLLLAREGNWYRIETNRKSSGWIHKSLVELRKNKQVNGPDQVELVEGDLRRGPRFQFRGHPVEIEDPVVSVIDRQGEWYQVQTSDGDIGWVQEDEVRSVSGGE